MLVPGETEMSFRCANSWSSIQRTGCRILLTAALLFLSRIADAQSAELRLQFSPANTAINFTLGDTVHTVHGSFNLKSGSVEYDPATATVRGNLVVDATSGQSGNHMRDHKMHREILESERYPEIAFRPDHVEGTVASS